MVTKAKKLRELFSKLGFFKLVGAHNGITAKLVEEAGFDGIWASSLEVSSSHAIPDANILTMSDYLNAAISMNDAVSIPVVVDVDQGYGNSTNVIHMVKKFEAAGIAGVMMEDKKFPKQNSLLANGRQELASIPEFVGKIMAAKNAQKTNEFMVMARIEALIAGWGHEEAVKRAKAYSDAGADAIMIHSKNSDPAEVIEFIEAWNEPTPIVLVPTNYPSLTEDKISQYPKVRMVIYANHVMRSSVGAIKQTLHEIKEVGGIHTVSPKLIPVKELFRLQGTYEMKTNEEKFLRTDKESVSVIMPAAGKNGHPSMKNLVAESPVCLLDVGGKSILQRNIEIFNSLGINEVNLIVGYLKDKINLVGINRIENDDYQTSHILHSLMKAEDKMKGKVLVAYSDILFEKNIIEQVLKSEADITLVVDSSIKTNLTRENKLNERDIVLVQATHHPIIADKVVRPERDNYLKKIGKKCVEHTDATHEYFGLAFFSAKGIEEFKKSYHQMQQSGELFPNGLSLTDGNFYHLIQKMIDQGYLVSVLEIEKGWMEVHTFDDYRRACAMLQGISLLN
jgi:phosphoenolpyruvate phosphomutase